MSPFTWFKFLPLTTLLILFSLLPITILSSNKPVTFSRTPSNNL